MSSQDDHRRDGETVPNRRSFLRATGLAGVGAAALSVAGAPAASATPLSGGLASDEARSWQSDSDNLRFTLVVMPDTQYLFDDQSINPEPVEAAFQYILNHRREENIVFMAHLGDLTQNGLKHEFDPIGKTFQLLDRRGLPYSVLAGNHDIDSSTDDQRGRTPYLDAFGPHRFRKSRTFGGATPDGYNTYHVFRAAGREWLVLALDWRPSAASIAWAQDVIRRNPKLPVILTTHELIYTDTYGDEGQFSEFGARLWDELIAGNDQIFLALNGHYWPPARTTRKNTAGHDVHVHITNYQNRYYGGAAMIRLYRFDLARNAIDVETFSPWVLSRTAEHLNGLERLEIEQTGPQDYFSMAIDFDERFSGFAPVPPRAPRPAAAMVIPGTVAYWRFDGSHEDGSPVVDTERVTDLSGRGNDLTKMTVPGSPATALTWSTQHHPDQPGHGSLYFGGNKNPLGGAYLQTVPTAPLNSATFPSGYTFEAFFKLPADWDGGQNGWAALLSRWGLSGEAGKTEGDRDEPVATLSLSPGRELQWAVYPLNLKGPVTNWGHELPLDRWWHVAVVNDGRHTTMYVDGCPVARNPTTKATGLSTVGLQWLLGGYEYGGKLDQILHGWVGDVRIADRALPVGEFMPAR
ncbi:LamG-like jellyroll fold domain-containing protein [Streptosporangium sp. CA-135522]|uniref:LamG-like jellyroll fold domain-containing protein n=1 Tax=Streptosporangium sp. CA-135522 TaxID=3240072 RepID=UPI003D93132D